MMNGSPCPSVPVCNIPNCCSPLDVANQSIDGVHEDDAERPRPHCRGHQSAWHQILGCPAY
eukprot:9881177-Heterocapsa_arctica.AAC.1